MAERTFYILAAEDCAACAATGEIILKNTDPAIDDIHRPCDFCHGEKYTMAPVEVFPHWVRGEVMFKLEKSKGLAQN